MKRLLALTVLMQEPSLDPLMRETSSGPVRGMGGPDGRTIAWLGVPYAAPPVGELRWRAPQPHPRWDTPRSATQPGPACLQIGGIHGPGLGPVRSGAQVADAFGQVVGAEDCLHLNVWRPATSATKLPTVVFIHGGANIAGYSGDPLYDAADLARRWNAVVVSVNYRLGVLGWFSHPALRSARDAESGSGNLALLDLVAALRFVQVNARAFGGDAGSVTVIGQSAGAVNSFALLASPLGKGLFHRAILMSGALLALPQSARDGYAEAVVRRLLVADRLAPDSAAADELVRDSSAAWLREYLESRPAERLVQVGSTVDGGGLPTADGVVLPADPAAAISSGRAVRVPLVMGTTGQEGKYFIKGIYLTSDAERWRLGHRTPQAPVTLASLVQEDLVGPDLFRRAAARAAEPVYSLLQGTRTLMAATGTAVYAYRFDWAQGAEPWRTLLGGTHGIDLPFLFGSFGSGYYGPLFDEVNEPGRLALSAVVLASLGGFVREGIPGPLPGVPRWPRWSAGAPSEVVFDASDAISREFLLGADSVSH